MLLHIDGSHHRGFQDDRWYGLTVIPDDASSEIHYAQLVQEKSTVTGWPVSGQAVECEGSFALLIRITPAISG